MPRPNPLRAVRSEGNLARRIAYERDRRSWTYDGTAKRLTEAGCPIQGSAIYKIEKGDPPRRISVDELVAFAAIFQIDVPDLLMPVAMIASQQAEVLITQWTQAAADEGAARERREAAWRGMRELVDSGQDAENAIADVLVRWGASEFGDDLRDEAAHYFLTKLRDDSLEEHLRRYGTGKAGV